MTAHKKRMACAWLCTIAAVGLLSSSQALAAENLIIKKVDEVESLDHRATQNIPPQPGKPKTAQSEWSHFIPPNDEKYDWIQLKSGEWLKGELKVMYNYSLEFDSDKLNLLKIKWKDVIQIRSAEPKSVRIESGHGKGEQTTLLGKLRLHTDKATVTFGEEVIEFDRYQIVSIATGTSKESDLWSGKISFGLNARGGNSDLIDSNINAKVTRRTAVSRVKMDYVGNFSQAEGIKISNNHRVNAQYDLFKSAKFFWRPISVEYLRDTFKNIDNQISLGTAFGYQFIRTTKTEWEVNGGIGVLYKRYVSVEEGNDIDNVSPTAGLGTKYETDLTNWLEYNFDFNLQIVDKASGSYIHYMKTTLSTDITGDLDLDISIVWDRIQKPQPAEDGTIPERDDYQLIVAIGYDF